MKPTYTEYEMLVWEKAFIALLGAVVPTGCVFSLCTAVDRADAAVEAYRLKRREARPE